MLSNILFLLVPPSLVLLAIAIFFVIWSRRDELSKSTPRAIFYILFIIICGPFAIFLFLYFGFMTVLLIGEMLGVL